MTIITDNETLKNWYQDYINILSNDKLFKPDDWQKKVLETKGNIAIRAGRQVGKSVTVARKCARLALEYPNTTSLMIAAAQRQSSALFEKTYRELLKLHDVLIARADFKPKKSMSRKQLLEERRAFELENGLFEETPTKTQMILKNGTKIVSLPTGKTGVYIRYLSIDFLIADEAAYIPEAVWTAVTPMLAVSQQTKNLGWTILLSTPYGKGGYFYSAFCDSKFSHIHVSSEFCSRISPNFLAQERQRLSKVEYAQEYLGEFIDEFNQFFPSELIKERANFIEWEYQKDYNREKKYYLGLDIARYGKDETAYCIGELAAHDSIKIVKIIVETDRSLTHTIGYVQKLNEMYKFRRILIDDAGLGSGVYDILREKLGHSKIIALNNASKSMDKDGRTGRILKEDLYSHALGLMENKKVNFIADMKLIRSLKSMQFEYSSNQNLLISGKYSHCAEAFVRCCWALKTKGLNLFIC